MLLRPETVRTSRFQIRRSRLPDRLDPLPRRCPDLLLDYLTEKPPEQRCLQEFRKRFR